jgi:STE24 endopeptidase
MHNAGTLPRPGGPSGNDILHDTAAPMNGEHHQAHEDDRSQETARRYARIKVRLSILDLALDLVFLAVLGFNGLASLIAGFVGAHIPGDTLQFLAFIAVSGAGFAVLSIPLDLYGGYFLEHRFRLSTQTIGGWIVDRAKSLLLAVAIGTPVALLLYVFLRLSGGLWWAYFSVCIFGIGVLLARVAPLVIFPLFYTFTPLGPGPVRDAIESLLAHTRIVVRDIFVFNMSRETRKANAGFTGLGRSRRIILGDTLLETFTPEEIRVIFAHELGHYSLRHILKNTLFSGGLIFFSFGACGALYGATLRYCGLGRVYDLPAIPILLFYLSLLSLATMPLGNALSRRFERAADRYALETTNDPESFISAMEKLASQNLADKNPGPIVEFLMYSHPSLKKRIEMADACAAPQVGLPAK